MAHWQFVITVLELPESGLQSSGQGATKVEEHEARSP